VSGSILLHGKIIPSADSTADFLLYSGSGIVACGCAPEMSKYLSPQVRMVKLGEAVALPGLFDSHVHLVQTGLCCMNIDLTDVPDKETALQQVAQQSDRHPEVVLAFGFDESNWKIPEMPTLTDLDVISSAIPILLARRDSHLFVINSKALQKFGHVLTKEELTPENINLGIFRGEAGYKLLQESFQSISEETKTEGVRVACRKALSRGITAIHSLEGGKLFGEANARLMQKLSPRLPLDVIVYPQVIDCEMVQKEMHLPRIGGCLLVDGSIGARTAALSKPYSDQPDNRGILYFSDEELFAFTEEANSRKMQIALHAIGDRAIEQTLSAYRRALSLHPRQDHRLRIEHFELGTDEQIAECARLGIIVAMQPTFERLWGGAEKMYGKRLGDRPTNRLATIIKAGVVVAGGSDSNITPLDSLLGMASAMSHPQEGERLSFLQALKIYTENCAYAGFQEDKLGRLEAGKRANITILSSDPRLMTPEELTEAEVEATIVGGRREYLRPGSGLKLDNS
jgi:predicted amidohydrolase YtcJ